MSCPRLFEAEASRDGRLSGPERASFERHVSTCAECKAEVSALAHLAALARARPAEVDELRAPRGRLRLIGAFNRELTEPAGPRWGRLQVPVVLAVCGIAMGLLGYRALSRAPSPTVATVEPERWSIAVPSKAPAESAPPATPVAPSATTSRPPLRTPVAPVVDSEDEYRAALAKLDAGDDRAAASSFRRFAEKYPSHVHAEDAAYLRVLCLQRLGDRPDMQAAAADYLRTYPNGFRANDVEKLAR